MRSGCDWIVEEHRRGRMMRPGDSGMNPMGIFPLPRVGRRMEGEESSVESSLATQQSLSGCRVVTWVQAGPLRRGKKHDRLGGGAP